MVGKIEDWKIEVWLVIPSMVENNDLGRRMIIEARILS